MTSSSERALWLVSARLRTALLHTPMVARIVPEGVFDAFGWCASETLAWSHPGRAGEPALTPARVGMDNPSGFVFVMHAECTFLPRELARLHAPWVEPEGAWALAPWAIDDATDGLYERRVPPASVLSLAAERLDQLVWGLHDWAHFHAHGPFEERAYTELQCDATALAWLHVNRATLGVDDAAWEAARRDLLALSAQRFAEEGKPFDPAWLAAERVRALVSDERR